MAQYEEITNFTGLSIQPNIETNNTNVHCFYVPYLTESQRDKVKIIKKGGLICLAGVGMQLGIPTGSYWYTLQLI